MKRFLQIKSKNILVLLKCFSCSLIFFMQSVIKKIPQIKSKIIYILHKENECTVHPKVAVFCMQIIF